MPDHDDLEDRLRRTFRWVAGRVEDRSASPLDISRGDALPLHIEGEEEGAFLDEGAAVPAPRPNRRPLVLAAAMVLLLAAVGISIGFVVSGTGSPRSGPHRSGVTRAAAARAQVISALGATTSAGNWDISYTYSQAPASDTSTTTTTTTSPPVSCPPQLQDQVTCVVSIQESGQGTDNVTVTGSGIIDVNPKAMVTDADPSNFGHVILRIDATQVWELGTDDGGGLAPNPSDDSGGGEQLSDFAGLVESTLGTREGAIAVLGIASPTGYLELDEQEITGVTPIGQGTVDGDAVSEYRVSADPSQLESDPSASPEEVATIQAALTTLQGQGLSATTTDLAVDAQGFIVQSTTAYQFSDGGSVTVQAQFSHFGCAGTVLMPGQTGPTAPPANCVSPDAPQSTTTTDPAPTTTTIPASTSSTTTTTSSTTSTTTPSSTSTTVPEASTTTTSSSG